MTNAEDPNGKELFGRTYAPAPERPGYIDPALLRIGGTNPFNESKLRIGWGMDLRTFRRGNPNAIKYRGPHSPTVGLDRWILEVWRPAEFYGSPFDWELKRYMRDAAGARIDLLGDYPHRGVYVMAAPICTAEGEFLPLTERVVEWIEAQHQAQAIRPFNCYSTLAGIAEMAEKTAKEEQAEWEAADAEADKVTDYYNTNMHSLNQERKYSFASSLSDAAQRAVGAATGILSQKLRGAGQ